MSAANQASWRLQKLMERQLAAQAATNNGTSASASNSSAAASTPLAPSSSAFNPPSVFLPKANIRSSVVGSTSLTSLETSSSLSEGYNAPGQRKFNVSLAYTHDSESEEEVGFVLY